MQFAIVTAHNFSTEKMQAAESAFKEYGSVEFDGKKIAFTHYPEFGEGMAASGKYDVVFFGHTHIKKEEKINNTLLINPGELMGRLGTRTFVIYDTALNKIEFFEL